MSFRSGVQLFKLWRGFCNSTAVKATAVNSTAVKESVLSSTPGKSTYLYVGSSNITYTVEPDLDFRYRFKDLESLKRLLMARGYDMTASFGDLDSLSARYHEWYRRSLELTTSDRKERMDAFKANSDTAGLEKYRESLNELDELEREVIGTCLRLPAELHPWTPLGGDGIRLATFLHGESKEKNDLDSSTEHSSLHNDILRSTTKTETPLLEFRTDPPQCFVLGNAARLLQSLERYFAHSLHSAEYCPVSPAHFIRTAMIEAYYGDSHHPDMNSPYYLPIKSIYGDKGYDYTWALNLAGHGPLAYLALFTRKMLARTNSFPLKFFSSGMAYSGQEGTARHSNDWNLFNFPIQRPTITMFVVYDGEGDSEITNTIITNVQGLLSSLELSFSIDQQPSTKLLMSEMSRVDFNAFSSSLSTGPVRLASVSNHGDFLSRRIRLVIRDQSGDQRQELESNYVKCCYAQIDLFNILARIYEEMYPLSDIEKKSAEDAWWPSCIRSSILD